MGEKSAIEWTDSTFNPWIGCTKVSPACDHCYAERDFDLRLRIVQWGAGSARKRTSVSNWQQPMLWNRRAQVEIDAWERFKASHPGLSDDKLIARGFAKPRRPRVFCASLADVFDNEVPLGWRRELFELIAATPNLDWLLLTKRIGNARTMMADALHLNPDANRGGLIWPLPNVWLGATICNQAEAERDIPKLLATPAAARFLSIEPMLGPIDLSRVPVGGGSGHHEFDPIITANALRRADPSAPHVDWVICGGESGPHARPMHPDWARSLRDQCAAAGVPFMFKQWGDWCEKEQAEWIGDFTAALRATDGKLIITRHDAIFFRLGKKITGRLLDGATHEGFPDA